MKQRKRLYKHLKEFYSDQIKNAYTPFSCHKDTRKDFKIVDFTNIDLSGIDLSSIDNTIWHATFSNHTNSSVKIKFENTNLSNTGLKFTPSYSTCFADGHTFSLRNCDLSHNDLSWWTEKDISQWKAPDVRGCNFSDTGLSIDFNKAKIKDVTNVIFDKNYGQYPESHWEPLTFNIETLMQNPFLKISSIKLCGLINQYLRENDVVTCSSYTKKEDPQKYIKLCEEWLKFDYQGQLKEFYELLKPKFKDKKSVVLFFASVIQDMDLSNTDLSQFSSTFLNTSYYYFNCTFENTILGSSMRDWTSSNANKNKRIFDSSEKNSLKNIHFADLSYSSWKDIEQNRIAGSPFTFRSNLYLELGRACNGKCSWCRNNSFDNSIYHYKKIVKSLTLLYRYLDSIVIGGGEPTLRMNDILKLKELSDQLRKKWSCYPSFYVFTNATYGVEGLTDLVKKDNIRLNISRHDFDDSRNADIFGLDKTQILSTNELEKLMAISDYVSLCATCFKGGLDSTEKITEYLRYAKEIGTNLVMLSTLHEDGSLGTHKPYENSINIDPIIYEEVKDHLRSLGFSENIPIYSTGGYSSTVFRKNNFIVAFKEYMTKKHLEEKWYGATKRTFDLSIDPSGHIFENWHQTSNPVQKKLIK